VSPGSIVGGETGVGPVTVHKVLPEDLTGTVTLTAPAGGGKVKFWAEPTKGTELGPEQLTWTTPAQLLEDTTVYVEGIATSGSPRDVELKAQFTRTDPDVTFADKVKMTSFVVQLEPITIEADSGVLYNPCGVELHGTAQYKVHVEPTMGEDEVVWHILDGYVGFVGWNAAPICTIMGDVPGEATLGVEIAGFRQAMPTIEMEVLEKETVEAHVYIVCDDFGLNAPTTAGEVDQILE
jgi:hypothetical protein